MRKIVVLILIISMFSLSIYGCARQESEPPQDTNINTENEENSNTEENEMEDTQLETTEEVTLYFGNQDATYVSPEKRTISVSDNISQQDIIKQVVEELIEGPRTEELNPTIPPETKVLSVRIENSIAYINFSEEMHTKHWGGAAGESMTINSIVNTLTEFDYINKVNITVNGEPLAIEHTILDEPIGRNEDMLQR